MDRIHKDQKQTITDAPESCPHNSLDLSVGTTKGQGKRQVQFVGCLDCHQLIEVSKITDGN